MCYGLTMPWHLKYHLKTCKPFSQMIMPRDMFGFCLAWLGFAYLDCLSILMTKAMLCPLFCSLTSGLSPHVIRTPQIPPKPCIILGQLMIMVDIILLSWDNALAERYLSSMHGLCLIILAYLFLILRQVSNVIINSQFHLNV